MERFKPLFLPLLLLSVSILLVLRLFPSQHYLGGLRLPLNAEQIRERSERAAKDLGINVKGAAVSTTIVLDRPLIRQVQESYGIQGGNELLRSGVRGYMWEVRLQSGRMPDLVSESDESEKNVERTPGLLRGLLRMRIDPWGRVVEVARTIDDSVKVHAMSSSEARALGEQLLGQFAVSEVPEPAERIRNVVFESEQRIETAARREYVLSWQGRSTLLPDTMRMEVRLAGDELLSFSAMYVVPQQFSDVGSEPVRMTLTILGYVLMLVLMVVVAIRKLKADEIGFRLAVGMGLFGALATMLSIYLSLSGEPQWQILFSVVLAPLLLGAGLVLTWAVGESVTREVWRDKLISFDLLSRGHLVHSRVGRSLIEGIAWGSTAVLVGMILQTLMQSLFPVWFSFDSDDLRMLLPATASPILVVSSAIYAKSFPFAVLTLFTLSWLRGRMAVGSALIVATAVACILLRGALQPYVPGAIVQLGIIVVVMAAFAWGDALASFLALITATVMPSALAFLYAGNSDALTSAVIMLASGAALAVVGIALQFRSAETTDFESVSPAFGKHISERQRLQHELEIARRVQMSFLPKESPSIGGIDLASRCLPALEVGGDYYDFLHLGSQQLGIVVGDVSGKGTQAAFYMTLAKGFLKALSERIERPLKVVQEMNKLFYANVERGAFISLIYGVLDLSTRTLTAARAGHNPLLLKRADSPVAEPVNSSGLALGLERGEVFEKSIEEVTIPLQAGDTVMFYTDGFPEAVNRQGEEFGLERLQRTLEEFAHLPAQEILERAFDTVKAYIGKVPQRDDMTMVVMKVQ